MTSPLRRRSCSLALLAMVAAFAPMAGAQGPSQPADPLPVASDALPADGARLLAANIARLAAANAPRAIAPRDVRPFAAWSESAQDLRDSILVSIARTTIGTRYVRGERSVERGFDCSGLVHYIMRALSIDVPRTAAQQANAGLAVGRDTTGLRPGDLLTFGEEPRGVSHVGIYVGNGRYVHASSVAGRVIESEIARPRVPLVKPWRGTRRVLSNARTDSGVNGDG